MQLGERGRKHLKENFLFKIKLIHLTSQKLKIGATIALSFFSSFPACGDFYISICEGMLIVEIKEITLILKAQRSVAVFKGRFYS